MAQEGAAAIDQERTRATRAFLLWVAVPLLGAVVAAGLAAQVLIADERERLRADWLERLEASAAQAAEVARLWFFERRMDADVLADSPITQRALLPSGEGGEGGEGAAGALAELTAVLERMRSSYGYCEVFVLTSSGEVVAAAPPIGAGASVQELAKQTAIRQRGEVRIVDDKLHLAFSAPLRGGGGGVVVLEMEPKSALHPRLATPHQTETGETLLVGAVPDGVVVLSPRRHGPNALEPVRVAGAAGTPFSAGVVLGGDPPAGEYTDYREHAVLAVLRHVDTEGFAVVSKIDRDEALAPLSAYRGSVYSFAGLALVALAGVVGTLRQRRRASALRAELERQEQALEFQRVEERATRLGRALDEASDEIYLLDARTLRIKETNARARVATGYDVVAMSSLSIGTIEPEAEDALGEIAALLSELRQGQRPLATWSTLHRRADGTRYPVDVRVHRTDVGAEADLLMVAADASARRDIEAQLLQAQKMEAVGRLAGGIAHDFNNLLTVMLVSLESLKHDVPPGSSLREEADDALAAAKRAAELTHQMLSFSRKQTLQPVVLDVNAVVRAFLNLLQRALREDVTLELALAHESTWARVDRGQLEQALLNLVGNARDAMPQGGRITLETAQCDAAGAPRDIILPAARCVVLRVRDTGVGMDENTLRQAFDPFFTTKPIGMGTGLGLAMVYGFVQQSGGAIHAKSREGAGTTFELYFPSTPAPEQRDAPQPSVVPTARGETVLVVDDSPQVRSIAARSLRAQGYLVLEAPGAPEAVRLFEEHHLTIALLLTDVAMPTMGGRALADALHARAPKLPVLFMSGYADDAVLREHAQSAHEAFLAKPFSPERLAEAVRAALDGRA